EAGFEPASPCGPAVFKTAAFSRSATPSDRPNLTLLREAHGLDGHGLDGNVLQRHAVARRLGLSRRRLDLLDHVHSLDHLPEDRVTEAALRLVAMVEELVVCDVYVKLIGRAVDDAGAS